MAKIKMEKIKPKKTYTWKIYSSYGYVEATDIVDAAHKMIEAHYGNKEETLIWGDFIIKEGRHNVY